jgi:hypothetical protein
MLNSAQRLLSMYYNLLDITELKFILAKIPQAIKLEVHVVPVPFMNRKTGGWRT